MRVHAAVYENVDSRRIYSLLQGTPHWDRFVDWLAAQGQVRIYFLFKICLLITFCTTSLLNHKMDGLAMALTEAGRTADAEALVLEFTKKNPTSRLANVRTIGVY